ncbi:MAG: aldehyde dehydrogenase family protein, partial [Candidatus Limnocylindrales bacterium]
MEQSPGSDGGSGGSGGRRLPPESPGVARSGFAGRAKLFIDGEFVDGWAGATIEVIDPHDCSVLAEVAEARAEDVDRAVAAATAAF